MWFLEHGLDLPAKRNNGDIVWRRPNYATLHRMIENPIYRRSSVITREQHLQNASAPHAIGGSAWADRGARHCHDA